MESILKTLIIFLTCFILSNCTWSASIKNLDDKPNEATTLSNVGANVSVWTNPTQTILVSAIIPDGLYSGKMCTFQDTNLIPANIKIGTNIFGVSGNLRTVNSNIHHSMATPAISQYAEVNQFSGQDLPSGYREIPDILLDHEGSYGATGVNGVTKNTFTGEWSAGTPQKVCGKDATTISEKIMDCDTQHSIKPTWDYASNDNKISWNGTINGNGSQGSWTLVTNYSSSLSNGSNCGTTCIDVWRDDQTGLLWTNSQGAANWCIAAGNAQINDPSSYCNNITYQPLYPVAESFCSETGSGIIAEKSLSGENWALGQYADWKGGLGKNSSPSVRWRLPTKFDYQQADNHGIKLVFNTNFSTAEWTATTHSQTLSSAIVYNLGNYGGFNTATRTTLKNVRCVGR